MPLEVAYAFNDTGSALVPDLSGNGRDLDLTGSAGAQVDGGRHGAALGKTGAAMPVLPASVLAASETTDRSLMIDAQGALGTWWVRWESDALSSGTWGILNLAGSMAAQARRDNGSLAERPAAPPPEGGTFHNYAIVYEQATGLIQIFYDGALADETSFLAGAGTPLFVGADRINLAEWSSTGPALDNLRIYSHALTPAEVADLAGTPVESASGAAELGVTLPVPEFAATATARSSAAAAILVPPPGVDMAASAHAAAALGVAVPTPRLDVLAGARAASALAAPVPTPTLAAAATARSSAALGAELPVPGLAASAHARARAELRVTIEPPVAGLSPTTIADITVLATLADQGRVGATLAGRTTQARLGQPRILAELGAR